ncbi:MAG: glycosyltransferase family 4 protein [Marinilabiliaceae bacterium]|nr:glycosyltransferase family 4 protein [Marinilabiliaceae bacterium]
MDHSLKPFKKLLIVSSEFPPGPGGIGNHAFSLAKALAAQNCQVWVVADANYAKNEEVKQFDQALPSGIHMRRVFRRGVQTYLGRIKKVASILRKEKIDTVILSGRFSLWIGGLLKMSAFRFKSIGILHGSEVRLKNQLWRRFTWWCIRQTNFLVPVSSFTHQLLPPQLQRKPFKVIENGIDPLEMNGLIRDKELKGSPVLLTVGNVTPRKGQHRVIKALPKIREKYPSVHYHVVGLPTYKEPFQQLAESLGVKDLVTFHGRLQHRHELGAVYSAADCFIMLSENQADGEVEGFGIVILEANYFKLPAIGAKGCGISAAIKDDYNGYLVDGDESDEILEKLHKVMENRCRLARDAYQWSVEHDWNKVVLKYIDVINGLN